MDDEPTTQAGGELPATPPEPTPAAAQAPPAPDPKPRGEGLQLLLWTLRFAVTIAAALALLGAGFMLAIFGLAGVALAIAVVLVAGAALFWRRGILPAAVLATAIALPATAAALSTVRFDRSVGTVAFVPWSAGDMKTSYRRGAGNVLIDLRHFTPSPGTTRIKARADNGRVVVALPTSRCFTLRVHYTALAIGGPIRGLARAGFSVVGRNSGGMGVGFGPMGLTHQAANTLVDVSGDWDGRTNVTNLLAFGRQPKLPGVYTRSAGPNAPVLDLDLTATDQMVVRDYPNAAAPLDDGYYGEQSQVPGMSWPQSLRSPQAPGELAYADRSEVRTTENRAKWVSWERRVLEWGKEQAIRYAGPCASRKELSQRAVTFLTQPERVRASNGQIDELIGGPTTRRSPIADQPVVGRGRLLEVEVNGLGEVHTLGTVTNDQSAGVIG